MTPVGLRPAASWKSTSARHVARAHQAVLIAIVEAEPGQHVLHPLEPVLAGMAGQVDTQRLFIGPAAGCGLSGARGRIETGGFLQAWLEQQWACDWVHLRHVAGNDHVPVAGFQRKQVGSEVTRQPHAAVRGRNSGQVAFVQRDARPGQALHVGHRGVGVEVGLVVSALLHDGEDALRGLMARLAGRDRRRTDQAGARIDMGFLLVERHDHVQRFAILQGGPLDRHVVAANCRLVPFFFLVAAIASGGSNGTARLAATRPVRISRRSSARVMHQSPGQLVQVNGEREKPMPEMT